MDMSRISGKFATTDILALDSLTNRWINLGLQGSLQVYDRFITERSFGQKKRILTVGSSVALPAEFGNYMLKGGNNKYILESVNEDISHNKRYGSTYLLHTSAHEVELLDDVTSERASGVDEVTGSNVVSTYWVDIERYNAEASSEFSEVNYTTANIYFPKTVVMDTTQKVRLTATGVRYVIEEVYESIDMMVAKSKRLGV